MEYHILTPVEGAPAARENTMEIGEAREVSKGRWVRTVVDDRGQDHELIVQGRGEEIHLGPLPPAFYAYETWLDADR